MEKLKQYWLHVFRSEEERNTDDWWQRKKALNQRRQVKIVRIKGEGRLFKKIKSHGQWTYYYLLYLCFYMKQKHFFYVEEQVIPYQFNLIRNELVNHKRVSLTPDTISPTLSFNKKTSDRLDFNYDRHLAVQYAERWWNSYNPKYETFSVDCTNFVSQCLHAGNAPMWGAPDRNRGWWYAHKNWSYSWSVAHSLRWYLSGATKGLKGREVQEAKQLYPGDVICYDFQGDNRWDHTTIVVTKDAYGMPLVNAHTDNSRHRFWSYEDSTAWTPNIKYKFFRIGE